MTQTEFVAALIADGWREYPTFGEHARTLYKRFDTPTPCSGNSDKPGQQGRVSVYREWNEGRESQAEVEITGGINQDDWVTLRRYSNITTVAEVNRAVCQLLPVWEYAANLDPHHPEGGK